MMMMLLFIRNWLTSLDDALADLHAAQANTTISIGTEDLIYSGDLASWIKFANSLKLRVLMRMSDVNDVAEQVRATVAAGDFIETADEIAEVPFTGGSAVLRIQCMHGKNQESDSFTKLPQR